MQTENGQPERQSSSDFIFQRLIHPSDRLIRHSVDAWRRELIKSLIVGITGSLPDLESIAVNLNQLALLFVYEGNLPDAMTLCELQITFWKNYSMEHRDSKALARVIQPWINTLRLARIGNDAPSAALAYQELAPENRSGFGSLTKKYNIELSVDELCGLSENAQSANETLSAIYWTEYPSALFRLGDHDELLRVLKLGLSIPCSSYTRASLLELLFWHHTRLGKVGAALLLLKNSGCLEMQDYALAFKAMELIFLAAGRSNVDEAMVPEVLARTNEAIGDKADGRSLNLAFDVVRSLGKARIIEREAELLVDVSRAASRLKDEAISFGALHRLHELNAYDLDDLRNDFCNSRYAFIRNTLGLESRPVRPRAKSIIVAAVSELAALNYSKCAASLV